MHAMQSGVAFEGGAPLEPKHLRVGVNNALVSLDALVRLLVAKGVFELGEYDRAATGSPRGTGRRSTWRE